MVNRLILWYSNLNITTDRGAPMSDEIDYEINHDDEEHPRRWRFDWLLPTFLHPRRTLTAVAEQEKPVWMLPMILLSVLILIYVLAAGPVRRQAAQMNMNNKLPPGFEYWLPEEQMRYQETVSRSAGFFTTHVTPALGSLAGLWIGWFLLGSLLHLGLTLGGSRSSNLGALNLAAWASLPLALRAVVQIIAVLATQKIISSPGLAGFAAAEPTGFGAFMASILALIDIYLIWQVILLLVGFIPLSCLKRGKAWIITTIIFLIILSLRALPAYISMQLSSLKMGGGFFFF